MNGIRSGLRFDSDAFSAGDRFDAYRELYSVGADVHQIGPGFAARMRGWRLDRSVLYDRRLSDVAHERDQARVRTAEMEHFTLTLVCAGEFHVDAGSGFRQVQPGEILILDMTRPMRNRVRDAHVVTMSIARERMALAQPHPRRLHGAVIPATRGALLADHLCSLSERGPLLTPAMLMPISRITLDLLRIVLADRDDLEMVRLDPRVERVDRMRAFVEEHLTEADFDPPALIERFALSRATLYRDFEPWGGPAHYIRQRRLERLRDRLQDPNDPRAIAELAAALGFSGENVASAAFLEAFGTRPGAYRRLAQDESDMARSRRRMGEWQSVLR
jgi:AraC-like DNA-binding protein